MATGIISGFGGLGYRLAVEAVADLLEREEVAAMTATALAPMEVATRLERLREALTEADGLLVTSLTNIRYLTGFTGSAGMLFVLPTGPSC